jgi:hypothetical protein
MRRLWTPPAALAALALTATSVLLISGASTAQPSKSQRLFRATLLDDTSTTTAVKRLLRDRGGFVAPEIEFADLTGDGRQDAVVLVDTGGAGGAVALYVFSTHGKAADSALRAVYRSQQLYRASAKISAGTLIVRTPRFAEGDDLCCPGRIIERVYAWNDDKKTVERRSTRELPGPAGTTPPTTATPSG